MPSYVIRGLASATHCPSSFETIGEAAEALRVAVLDAGWTDSPRVPFIWSSDPDAGIHDVLRDLSDHGKTHGPRFSKTIGFVVVTEEEIADATTDAVRALANAPQGKRWSTLSPSEVEDKTSGAISRLVLASFALMLNPATEAEERAAWAHVRACLRVTHPTTAFPDDVAAAAPGGTHLDAVRLIHARILVPREFINDRVAPMHVRLISEAEAAPIGHTVTIGGRTWTRTRGDSSSAFMLGSVDPTIGYRRVLGRLTDRELPLFGYTPDEVSS